MSNDRVQPDPEIRETPTVYASPSGLDPNREATAEEKRIWITAWRRAAVELARIRDVELRAIDDETATMHATWLGPVGESFRVEESQIFRWSALMMKLRAEMESASAPETGNIR